MEDERLDQIKDWWKEYRWTLIGGVSLGLTAVIGFNGWNSYQTGKAEAASDLYEQITLEMVDENFLAANELAQQLVDEFPDTAYAGQTVLLRARIHYEMGEIDQAYEALRWVIDNASEDSSVHAARIRLARLMNAENDYEGALKVLDIGDMSGFESHYRELRGDALRGLQRFSEAHSEYERSLETIEPGSPYRSLLTLKMNDTRVQDSNNS